MPILERILNGFGLERRSNPLENPSVGFNSTSFWSWLLGSRPTASGELISEANSLETVTVYACVRVIGESIASLPLKLYQSEGKGRKEAVANPLYRLLAHEPNPEMSAFTFYETLAGCLALCGNCYAQIQRDSTGTPIALWPLHPQRTEPVRMPDKSLAYKTTDGEPNGRYRIVKAVDMLHVPLFCFDGLKGLSPIHLAALTIGSQRAAQKFGAKWFGNGSKPGGIMSTKSTTLDEQDMINVRESWESMNGGENQGRTAFLPGDWTYSQIGLSPEESQFLGTLQHGRTEIAALFRVPSHMVGDNTRLSNSNHEQMALGFVTDTLRPYISRLEGEFTRKLIDKNNTQGLHLAFDVSERLRTDFQTTMKGYATGIQWGWFNRQEIRSFLGENPGPDELDVYMVPVNMMNAELLLDTESIQVQPLQLGGPQSDDDEDGAPKPGDGPDDGERSALGRYTTAYIHLFRDAVNRALRREKKDAATVRQLFEPILRSIVDASGRAVSKRFASELDRDWFTPDSQAKVIDDVLKAIEKRSAAWTASDELPMVEMLKCVRAIHVNSLKLAASRLAIGELADED